MGAVLSARPLIGVSTSEVRRPDDVKYARHGEPPRQELALGFAYMQAIEEAGGTPVILPPLGPGNIGGLLDRLDGLCLSGGPDLDPACYGAIPEASLGPTEPELDRFELRLARRALGCRMPLLAICRGMQVLNVALGGTLIAHLPDRDPDLARHRQTQAGSVPTHSVRLASSSRLARVVGGDAFEVNSFHHQAIDRIGVGLRAVAWAPGGVVEAVERAGKTMTIGVQWHAESLVDRSEHARLFRGFVAAAGQRREPVPAERAA